MEAQTKKVRQNSTQQWNVCSHPLVSRLLRALWLLYFWTLFFWRPKAFKRIPSASKSDKRQVFAPPSSFSLLLSLLVVSTKRKALVWKLKAPLKCRLLFLFLYFFLSSPRAFSFPTGWPLVWRMPLSHRALPPLCSQGTGGPVVGLWRGWEKSLEPHSEEKKSLSLWRGGVAPGCVISFLVFPREDGVEGADVNIAEGPGRSGGFNVTSGIVCHIDYLNLEESLLWDKAQRMIWFLWKAPFGNVSCERMAGLS